MRVNLLVDRDMDAAIVAGAVDGYVPARICDGKRAAGNEGLIDGLIALMLVAKQFVNVVHVHECVAEEVAAAFMKSIECCSGNAHKDDQRENPAPE